MRAALRFLTGAVQPGWWAHLRSEQGDYRTRYDRLFSWFLTEPRFVQCAVVTLATYRHPGANQVLRLLLGRLGDGGVAGLVGVARRP